ncbi:MAG: hypothetical protein ISS25_01520 [Nanoarchaeota archaeon]|nr:hypothetical protein [DPANN group archaeon]MBL7116491.1 hypothetical protein [Nanoarchaeota archaeon]
MKKLFASMFMLTLLFASLVLAQLDTVPGLGSFITLFAGALVLALIIGLAVYVYIAIALMTIAKKTNTPLAWLAWIPLANIYLMTQIADLSWWWTLAILLPIIPFIGQIALIVIMVWWWWKIAEKRGFPGWLGILTIIPLVNLIVMGVLAWAEHK